MAVLRHRPDDDRVPPPQWTDGYAQGREDERAEAEVERPRRAERDVLIDFCAHLESRHDLKVPVSWAAMVDAFLAEYEED